MICPSCQSKNIKLNGHIHHGNAKSLLQSLRAAICAESDTKIDFRKTKALIDRLLLEKISLAGIARSAEVSEQYLQDHISHLYASCPNDLCADLPDQSLMHQHLEDKFDQYIYEIAPLKKTLVPLSLKIQGLSGTYAKC